MYRLIFSAAFPERLAVYLRSILGKPGMSWRNIPITGEMSVWQSMAFRRFANHRDSYYVGGNYGEADTILWQQTEEGLYELVISATIPAECSDLVFLLKQMLDNCAVEWCVDYYEINETLEKSDE